MNTNIGKITRFPDVESLREAVEKDAFVPIDEAIMTEKQKATLQVSLKDHKSPLGKQLTRNRKRSLKRKRLLRWGNGEV